MFQRHANITPTLVPFVDERGVPHSWPSPLSNPDLYPEDKDAAHPICSLFDYLALIEPLAHKTNSSSRDSSALMPSDFPRHYFRGQFCGTPQNPFLLNPALSRNHECKRLEPVYNATGFKLQSALVERIRRYAEHFAGTVSLRSPPDNFLSWLTIAQHHRIPTYLMDWTLNPLVALYFAIDDVYTAANSMDGEVWCFDVPPKRARLTDHIVHLKSDGMNRSPVSPSEYVDSKLIKGFEEDRDFSNVKIIVPELLTRRIDSQSGRFVYYSQASLNDVSNDLWAWDKSTTDKPWHKLRRICTIDKQHKQTIAEQLVTFRVHPGTVWADMDGYAQFLRWGGL